MTKIGYDKLVEELNNLKTVERPAIIIAIAEARAHGDLSENAEYSSAKEKQGFIEGRIADLESKMARAEVINISNLQSGKIIFGATVTLIDEDTEEKFTYQLVSDYEADLSKNLISVGSPMGRALLGKSQGDEAEVTTPRGIKYYEIIKVEFI
jgi:transcription elongation factor GreA